MLSKEQDYTGKWLRSHWDNELLVLSQLDDLLFCMSYSANHQTYRLTNVTVDGVNEWGGFEAVEETPYWWHKELMEGKLED